MRGKRRGKIARPVPYAGRSPCHGGLAALQWGVSRGARGVKRGLASGGERLVAQRMSVAVGVLASVLGVEVFAEERGACDGWQIERDGDHVRAARGAWSARGERLEMSGSVCALEGDARVVGPRWYVSAARLELSGDRVSGRDARVFEGAESSAWSWRAARVVVWLGEGRVELEGVSPAGERGGVQSEVSR